MENTYLRQCFITLFTTVLLFPSRVSSYDCDHPCGSYRYCCGENMCCRYTSYGFWSMWYFWFLLVLFIVVCIAGCGYYRRRQRFVAMRRNCPVGVVVFSRGNEVHDDPPLPPSYQETVSKPAMYPPPYYSAAYYGNANVSIYGHPMNPVNVHPHLPPYPGAIMMPEHQIPHQYPQHMYPHQANMHPPQATTPHQANMHPPQATTLHQANMHPPQATTPHQENMHPPQATTGSATSS